MGEVIELGHPLKNIQMLCEALRERYGADRVTIRIESPDGQTLEWMSRNGQSISSRKEETSDG
jgi:hypothetical protein